jgi:MFS family permease
MRIAARLPLYGTIATLALTRVTFGFQLQTVATLAPDMMVALALDFATLGGLIGAYLAPGVFVALPGGFLARRFGDRLVAVGSAWLIVLGGVLAALAVQRGWGGVAIAAGRAVAGIGAVGLSVMQSKMVADRFTPQTLPAAMAVLLGAFPIGIGLAQVVLPPLAAAQGLAAAFWLGAVAAGVTAVLFTLAWTDAPHAAPRTLAWPSGREMALVSVAGLIWMVYNAAWFNFMAWMPSLLVARGHPGWMADTVLSIATWANLPAMLLGGWMAARFGRTPVFVGGLLVCAVSVAAPAVHDMPLLWGIIFGTVASMPGSLIVEMGAVSCRAENRAVGMGIFYVTYYIGGAVMPALCGAAADWAADPGGALVFAAAVSLLGLPLWFLHGRMTARVPEPDVVPARS